MGQPVDFGWRQEDMAMIELENDVNRSPDSEESTDLKHALRGIGLDKEASQGAPAEPPYKSFLGRFVLFGGILLPVLAITCAITANIYPACGVLLRHWVETLVQFGMLLSIPAGIGFVWSRIHKNDMRRVRLSGHLIGFSIGSAFLAAVVLTAAVILKYPTNDYQGFEHTFEVSMLAMVSWCALLAAVCVGIKFRELWPTKGARRSSTIYMIIGAGLSLVALFASEAKSVCVRIAEKLVIAGTSEQKKQSLDFLRAIDCERSMRIDCSTPRAYGLSDMFARLDDDENKKLYFLTTGQPFRLNLKEFSDFAALPDEMLGKQVVGDKVSNLSMHRSLISGTVHPESLTSTIDWTFVFKNTGFDAKEARAEIGLPKDAVISEMVLWINGLPKRATISNAENAKQAYQWVVGGRRDPALVTDLGKGRVLVQCYPVPAQGEVRIKISMKSSMKLDKAGEAIASLPTLLKSNFEMEGEHRVHLRSDRKLLLDLDNVRHVVANNGLHQITGTLATAKRSKESIDVRVVRDANIAPVAIKDPFDQSYIVQQYVPTVAKRPDHLVVVVDSSETVAEYKDVIAKQLAKIPSSVPTSLIVASDLYKEDLKFKSLKDGIAEMKKIEFNGGQENLGAVIQGAELAGETEGGAVLWIHGPQPALDKELYIVEPYLVKPNFFDLSIEDSVTDSNEFFKNHQEIGPFTSVARNSTFEKDLSRFLSRWQTDGVDYTLTYAKTFQKPAVINESVYVQDEISRLYVAQKVRELISTGKDYEAANLATTYQIVSPVTSAVVLENARDYARFGLNEAQTTDGSNSILANSNGNVGATSGGSFGSTNTIASAGTPSFGDAFSTGAAPTLQGAVNGTIGPQGGDATTIMGVNTAGTVRVNNLANLEALLNIIANASQLIGVLLGGSLLLFGLKKTDMMVPGTTIGLSRNFRIFAGLALVSIGVSAPGFVNYMVASARDANLFS